MCVNLAVAKYLFSVTIFLSYLYFRSLVVKDINGDGNDDMIVGSPKYSPDTTSGQGRVNILYGNFL